MNWLALPYALTLLVGSVIALLVAVAAWRRREIPGASSFALAMAAVALCSAAYCVELLNTRLEAQVFWDRVLFLGIEVAPIAWLLTGARASGRDGWLVRLGWAPLALSGAITIAEVWSGDGRGLVWVDVYQTGALGFPAMVAQHGPLWWANISLCYAGLAAGTVLIWQSLRGSPREIWQARVGLLAAVAILLTGGLINALGQSGTLGLDPTPLGLTAAGAIIGWVHFRLRFLDVFLGLVPVAHDAVVAGLDDGVVVVDSRGLILDLNPAARRILGLGSRRVSGEPLLDLITETFGLTEPPPGANASQFEVALADGPQPRYYEVRATRLERRRSSDGQIVVLHDISERKRAEQALRESEQRFRAVVEQSRDGVYIRSQGGELLLYNRAMEEIIGYAHEEANALGFLEILYPDPQRRAEALDVTNRMTGQGHRSTIIEVARKDGSAAWLRINTVWISLDGQRFLLGTVVDVIEQELRERRLAHLAAHDALTGLPNRRAFEAALAERLARTDRASPTTVLFLDADHFKEVNDCQGHAAGDTALRGLSRIVKEGLRDDDLLARVGGDEFAVLLSADLASGRGVAERVVRAVDSARLSLGPVEGHLTVSVGLVCLDEPASVEEALARADSAMYAAKRAGRNRVAICQPILAQA